MSMRSVPQMWLGAGMLAVLAGCHAPAPAPIAAEVRDWTSPVASKGVELLTTHFDMRITAKDPFVQQYLPAFLETAYGEYQRLVPPVHENNERLVVYVFGTRSEWADFTRGFAPAQAYTYLHIQSGGYTDHRTATAVAYDVGRDRTLSLLGHEGLHQYLARQLPEPAPSWVGEGLACQFEAFDMRGDRPVFTPRRNFLRRNSLREALAAANGLIPLSELLRMNAADAVRQTGQPARAFYAQVWSLVLFLRDPQSGYAEKLAALLRDVGTERLRVAMRAYRAATADSDKLSDGEVVFRQYITEDLEAFGKQYRGFAQALLASGQ